MKISLIFFHLLRLFPALAALFIGSMAHAQCQLMERTCMDGPTTRNINGLEVYRECWRYEERYECLSAAVVSDPYCGELRDRGCGQVDSRCITPDATNGCLSYEQTFQCPSGEVSETVLDCGGQLLCMDGACFDAGYPPNTNLGSSAASLSVMSALSQELASDHVSIFRGEERRCSEAALSVRNCCTGSGWANNSDLTQCSPAQQQTGTLREAGQCHALGSYCSQNTLLGACVENTQTFCCFGSKLARIIAEQGRLQLGRGWGGTQNPDCSGFTLEEFAALDIAAMDLSEFYADILEQMPDVDMEAFREQMMQRMNTLLPP
jgi:type-F conjugative transfer system mating-pair stabilization protein TraN